MAVVAALNVKQPIPTKDLLEKLVADGVEISGSDKLQRLSSILSREKKRGRFTASRKDGWRIAANVRPIRAA